MASTEVAKEHDQCWRSWASTMGRRAPGTRVWLALTTYKEINGDLLVPAIVVRFGW
jgi:hypothetical protein